MVAIREVVEKEDVVVITNGGIVIRQHASEIRVAGRNTQGVRLIKLDAGDAISDVAVVLPEEEEPTNGDGTKGNPPPSGESNSKDQTDLFGKSAGPDPQKSGGKGPAKPRKVKRK